MVNFSPHTGSQQSPKKLSARASVLWLEDKISTPSKYDKKGYIRIPSNLSLKLIMVLWPNIFKKTQKLNFCKNVKIFSKMQKLIVLLRPA